MKGPSGGGGGGQMRHQSMVLKNALITHVSTLDTVIMS